MDPILWYRCKLLLKYHMESMELNCMKFKSTRPILIIISIRRWCIIWSFGESKVSNFKRCLSSMFFTHSFTISNVSGELLLLLLLLILSCLLLLLLLTGGAMEDIIFSGANGCRWSRLMINFDNILIFKPNILLFP